MSYLPAAMLVMNCPLKLWTPNKLFLLFKKKEGQNTTPTKEAV